MAAPTKQSAPSPRVKVWDAAQLKYDQALAIADLHTQVWRKPDVTAASHARGIMSRQASGEYTATGSRWYVVLDPTGTRVLTKAKTFHRAIVTDVGPMTILALSAVCTDPGARGRGLGSAVVRAALGRVDAGELVASLFQTARRNQKFYEALGAVLVDNRIVNGLGAEPQANAFWDQIVMRYPATAAWPVGTIDLRGPGY
jgi:GNAT superfamily N-acetyltransferase